MHQIKKAENQNKHHFPEFIIAQRLEIFPLFLYIHVHVSTDSTPGKDTVIILLPH